MVVASGGGGLPEEVDLEWSLLPPSVRAQLDRRAPSVVFGPPPSSSNDALFHELKDALALARTAVDVIVTRGVRRVWSW